MYLFGLIAQCWFVDRFVAVLDGSRICNCALACMSSGLRVCTKVSAAALQGSSRVCVGPSPTLCPYPSPTMQRGFLNAKPASAAGKVTNNFTNEANHPSSNQGARTNNKPLLTHNQQPSTNKRNKHGMLNFQTTMRTSRQRLTATSHWPTDVPVERQQHTSCNPQLPTDQLELSPITHTLAGASQGASGQRSRGSASQGTNQPNESSTNLISQHIQ